MTELFVAIGFILCASIIILCEELFKNRKEISNLKENNESLKKQNADLNKKLLFTQNENKSIKEQMDAMEAKETDLLKKSLGRSWDSSDRPYSDIFEGYKAIIGNYDSYTSNITRKMLRNFGLSVDMVKTGVELFERIENGEKYDIIFTNHIYQQGFHGEELLKKLRNLEGFKTPVVIHTIDKDARERYVDFLGFDEYLEKPIQYDELEKVLHKFLKPNKKS